MKSCQCALPAAFLPVVLLFAFAAPAVADEPAVSQEVIDRIQRTALRAYPPEMLAEMTSEGLTEVPPEADAAPQDQDELLDQTLEVEMGLFYPFLLEDLVDAFELYVGPGTRFLDLGSGDGRVVFLAATLGAQSTGIEYEPELVELSRSILTELDGVVDPKHVRFVEGDFFASSWSGYDVIFYFDLSSDHQGRVRKKLARELDPGARLLVGHQRSDFPGLSLETTFESIHVYRQPEVRPYDPTFSQRCRKEVAEFHSFLEDWLNGAIPEDSKGFERFAQAFAPAFETLGPSGAAVGRAAYLERLRRAHGSWRRPDEDPPQSGSLSVEGFHFRLIEGPMAVATYRVRQELRGEVTVTVKTAIFRLRHGRANGVEWYHVHETPFER